MTDIANLTNVAYKKGNWMRFRISSLKTRQSFSAATFQYKESDHPGVEVIDLR